MVNSRRFALEYEIESVGAAGVAKIETWGTRDGGRTWASYGVEPSRQGPVRVSCRRRRSLWLPHHGARCQRLRRPAAEKRRFAGTVGRRRSHQASREAHGDRTRHRRARGRVGNPLGSERRNARDPSHHALVQPSDPTAHGRRLPRAWTTRARTTGDSTTACPTESSCGSRSATKQATSANSRPPSRSRSPQIGLSSDYAAFARSTTNRRAGRSITSIDKHLPRPSRAPIPCPAVNRYT